MLSHCVPSKVNFVGPEVSGSTVKTGELTREAGLCSAAAYLFDITRKLAKIQPWF